MSYLIYRKNGFVPIRIVHRDPHIVCGVMEKSLKQEYGWQYIEVDEDPELAALRARVENLEADLHQQTHETVGAEMERDELRALLKKSEFAGEGFCWSCGLYYGHDEGACELQAALRGEA